ncbi:hypothetical protein RB195_015296 [Necator americanus]|uniref:FH2 domain-containing protein n=1 Tax=Necator americanus TaxID=51031 RepID=A0ABR1E402_NECAM
MGLTSLTHRVRSSGLYPEDEKRKSDGDDGKSVEMLEYLSLPGIREMTKIIRLIGNYQRISLFRVMYDVPERIILDSLIKYREETARDEQATSTATRPQKQVDVKSDGV